MSTITMQRDLVFTLKEETNINISLLSKLYPMSSELSRTVFKENALEKPTKTLFNNLSYYLVCLIDPNQSLTWPLFDSKAERTYRNELSQLISTYSKQGSITPIISSYLVNPACYKVTVLLFELSQLALKQALIERMVNPSQKELFRDMTEKYKSNSNDFIDCVDKQRILTSSRLSNHLMKRKTMEKIAELFRNNITKMELSTAHAQQYINKLIDDFVLKNNLDDTYKAEILKIKDVNKQSIFFDSWLQELDSQLDLMEYKWNINVSPYLETSCQVLEYSKCLINKQTGQTERSSYMIEYNPNEKICTKDLEAQVNSQQRFVLKNIDIDGKLSFPNLIRGFVIAASFVLKNTEIGDEIYKFHEYLDGGNQKYNALVSALEALLKRVINLEGKLQLSPSTQSQSFTLQKYNTEFHPFPPLPDLSDLNTNCIPFQTLLDSVTPLKPTRKQFSFLKTSRYFARPQTKLIAPVYQAPREDFLKSLLYQAPNDHSTTQYPNISTISSIKANETIAECSSGFTKQQILRLLSTKKTSSSKKHKFNYERPNIKVKKGGLFSDTFSENNGLYRSHSSPNLFENREKRCFTNIKGRKLSIMQEDTVSQLELSGIACLEGISNLSTPQGNAESSRKENTSDLPLIKVNGVEERLEQVVYNIESEMNKLGADIVSPIAELPNEEKAVTPKPNTQLIKKTSSLEKIINRFKKVRANVMQKTDEGAIAEEKENINTLNRTNSSRMEANRILLPDLLSPSCSSTENIINIDYLDQVFEDIEKTDSKKPRESLGTALGVDQTFLDQFNLVD